ncbi:MAG: hypothetical protein R3E75_00290 [Steroidobacteraceae bacterium]|nr:hypothetical protein [Nevskiaceae bacterium]MCP5339409.1 hypothetical protein [Nevskiaceae bacterium]MCP5360519.1 hypothetical protein [Nevskiaceae bacterium]MCP5472865.1 hypothetical protein [Nevskiaceae bacterium]
MIPFDRAVAGPVRALLAVTLCAVLAGCSSLPRLGSLWPFGAKPVAAAPAVDEIAFAAADGAASTAFPQYWKRNTLVVDLSAAPVSGSFTMTPRSAAGWPVRLAFRVRPGTIGQLEVQAAQRVLLPVSAAATGPVDLELAPSVYLRDTPQIRVSWSQSSPGV